MVEPALYRTGLLIKIVGSYNGGRTLADVHIPKN